MQVVNIRAMAHAEGSRLHGVESASVPGVWYRTDRMAELAYAGLVAARMRQPFSLGMPMWRMVRCAPLSRLLRRHQPPGFIKKVIMSFNSAVVWIDHTKAQVIHFDMDAAESESLKTHSTHPHTHQRHGDSHSDDSNTRFFNDIADVLKNCAQILVVGPAKEKTAFVAHLTTHVPAVAEKIKAVETVDHPSNGELLAHARKYFVRAGGVQ
jgi:hypothetical protein